MKPPTGKQRRKLKNRLCCDDCLQQRIEAERAKRRKFCVGCGDEKPDGIRCPKCGTYKSN